MLEKRAKLEKTKRHQTFELYANGKCFSLLTDRQSAFFPASASWIPQPPQHSHGVLRVTWEVKIDGRRLTQGWEKFATTHDLRVGDIVVFRHDGALLFHVTCFGPSCCEIQYDADDDDVIQLSSDSDSNKNQNTEAGETSSDHSCFVTCVTASYLRKDTLYLPNYFSRSNGLMNRRCEIILLNEDRKPWRLLLTHSKSGGWAYIRNGWRGTTPVLQLCSSVYKQECLRASSSSPTTSEYRFLTLTLTPYNNKKHIMYLPSRFVKANGIENASKITLVDRYGIKTTISLKPEDRRRRKRLGREWREFCKANGVQIGESFKLELIKEKKDTTTHLLKFCSKVS